jgi:perosamine synthetase
MSRTTEAEIKQARDTNSRRRDVPAMKPFFPEEDIAEMLGGFEKILRSSRLTLGSYTKQFEGEFAQYIGTKHAVAASSGTSTLEMIYRSLQVEGGEVITPTNTHIATSNAVIFAGGTPVLADIEADTLCIDVEDAFSKINEKTRAIVVVHLAGLIHPRIYEIRRRCKEKGIALIEDAAHAHGATIDGRKAGSLSDAGSFSFYPAKVVTSIEGGMITTDDDQVAEVSEQMRNHGTDSRGLQIRLGYNWRMSELHSCVGLIQMRRIEEIIKKKNEIAAIYNEELRKENRIKTIDVPPRIRHSYYKYPVTIARGPDASKIQQVMKNRYSIETGTIYYPPCHLEPVYRTMFPDLAGKLPVSEDVLARTISLPIYAGMDPDDAMYVAHSLVETIKLVH